MSETIVTYTDLRTAENQHRVWNTDYLKSVTGLLKLTQIVNSMKFIFHNIIAFRVVVVQILGSISVGIMVYLYSGVAYYVFPNMMATQIFFLMATTFMIGSLLLFFCRSSNAIYWWNSGQIILCTKSALFWLMSKL